MKNGNLSGFSVRAWFKDSDSFNPSTWIQPLFGKSTIDPIDDYRYERYITVSTRDPKLACMANTDFVDTVDRLGDRLIVNANINNTSNDNAISIPLRAPGDSSGWEKGACMANMGQHWGHPLLNPVTEKRSLYGESHGKYTFPINPMYSVIGSMSSNNDIKLGEITALAFFTTEPQVTQGKNGLGVWDASGTPEQLCGGNYCIDASQCIYGESNSVFHVFFIDQFSDMAQCGHIGSPGCQL